MKIFLANQTFHLQEHLLKLKEHSPIPYNTALLKHKTDSQIINASFATLHFNHFFEYRIFPINVLSSFPQWIIENREMQIGDTIVQQINIPPFSKLSARIIVGVRIIEVINSDTLKSFSYETLEGHVEKGISTFKIEVLNDISILTIETYSSPALAFLNAFKPFSSLYQDYCTKQALINTKYLLTN